MNVAWHEMPGKVPSMIRPVAYGMTGMRTGWPHSLVLPKGSKTSVWVDRIKTSECKMLENK